MKCLARFSFLPIFLAMVVGCGPQSVPVEQPSQAPQEAVVRNLEMVAESGQLGSEMMEIQQSLEEMKATDSETATELLADLEEMESMTDPAAVKAKANEMLGKLGGGAAEAGPAEEEE